MKITNQSFFIPAELKPLALLAIKEIKTDACPYSIWAASQGVVLGKVLEEGMVGWRYCPRNDNKQNVVGLIFLGDRLLDDEILFRVLARYVQDGSYLDISASEGKWRWSFQNGQMFWEPYGLLIDQVQEKW